MQNNINSLLSTPGASGRNRAASRAAAFAWRSSFR